MSFLSLTLPAPVAGVAPGQVGVLIVGSVGITVIPVTYTAPSTGTGLITYAGYTSPHGANAWTLNGGTFTSTGGTFIGLAGGTDYDLRVVATNTYGSSSRDFLVGVMTTTAAFSGASSRYDVVPSASAVSTGTPVTLSFFPNGTWSGETLSPAALAGSGTFSPTTIATTSGSSSPVTCTYTPSATGEHYVSCTNTGALFNPYPASLNVYSASAGTARTLAAALASGLDQQQFLFDSLQGVAAGFSLTGALGWGEVWLNLSSLSGSTGGLFVKLYDALSSGASASVGSGTALHASPVQVYGAVSATGTVRLLLPASTFLYYAEIATDAAFTNPVRIAQRFGVGMVVATNNRSHESGLSQWWDNANATGETNNRTVVIFSGDYRYGGSPPWYRHDGGSGDPVTSNVQSAGPQAAGRIIASALGVSVGIVGMACNTGGGLDEYLAHDGSLSQAFKDTINGSGINQKFRWFWQDTSSWDNVSPSYPESLAEYQARYHLAPAKVLAAYPACAVVGITNSCSGRPEPNGSGALGYTRIQQSILAMERSTAHVVSKENYAWGEFSNDHATNSSKRLYVQTGLRQLLSAETAAFGGLQTQNRGPELSDTGTIASGSQQVRVPYKLHGGTRLQTVRIVQGNPSYTISFDDATALNLSSLVSVYGPGGYAGNGLAIKTSGVAVDTSSPPAGYDGALVITLVGSGGQATFSDNSTATIASLGGLNVHWAADLNTSGTGYVVQNSSSPGPGQPSTIFILCDDQVSGQWEFGRHIRPKCDVAVSIA